MCYILSQLDLDMISFSGHENNSTLLYFGFGCGAYEQYNDHGNKVNFFDGFYG